MMGLRVVRTLKKILLVLGEKMNFVMCSGRKFSESVVSSNEKNRKWI